MRWKGLVAAASALAVLAISGTAGAAARHTTSVPDFGPNVKIFDPSMSTADIAAQLNAVATQQVSNEFGTQRYAFFFMPGTYGSAADPLNTQVGYYTQIAGLGRSPEDVDVNGTFDVYNQCGSSGCVALTNFWRSLSNLRLDVAGKGGCQSGEFWAVSQASPMRRVHVNGFATLMDYCTGPSFASGGFIADSSFTSSTIVNGSQQQWLTRNSDIDGWSNGVWNQVFAGVNGAPAQSFGSGNPYTTLATNPESREAPYLYVDSGGAFNVFVPSAQTNSSGTTWAGGPTPGRSLPISRFYIAKPGDSLGKINLELLLGKNLILTPGVYNLTGSIVVTRPNTIVMGLGEATLTAANGNVPLVVGDVPGAEVSGLIIDSGPTNSPALLQVGTPLSHVLPKRLTSDAGNPTLVADVFFRDGGPHVGKATQNLVVDANNVILDDIWAWRADHGSGVGWTSNTSDTGVLVRGDDVEATGLFSEHFQRYDVVWSGQNGKTIFFQNEMPYDPPDQASWQHDGVNGFAAYKVTDNVKTHEGWGLGSYCFFNVNPSIHSFDAFEVPVTPGVKLHDILDLSITNAGTIDHVVNGTGPATPPDTTPNDIVSYP